MLNLIKLNLLNKKGKTSTENEVKTLKHFPSSIREWNNSVYVYNKNSLNLIPNTMIATIKIIKGYFSLYNYKIEKKIRTKRLSRKFRKLSSNKIYINNGEFKHTNNKIIINLYLYNRQKHNYMLAINKLYIKTIKKTYKPNLNWNNKLNKLANIGNKKKINQYKLINRYNKYKSKNVKLNKYKLIYFIPKSLTIKTYVHKLKNFIYYKDNQLIKYIYSIYKLLCIKQLKINNINIYKYKLNCINTHKLKNIKLYKKNNIKNKFNKYKFIGIKLFNISLKNTKANEYKLFNLRLIRPKYWINLRINKNKLKINKYYNKFELGIINLLEKYILRKILLKYLIKNTNISIRTILKKKIIKSSKFNKSIVKKVNIINRKGLLLLYFINREKYLILKYYKNKNNKRMVYYISSFINKYYKKFLKKSWRKLKTYFFYRQLMYINKSKYSYSFLQYLSKYLFYLYNKNIEYNLINLKRFYLHSDILSESIKLKLNINKKKMLKQLNTIKKKIKTRKYKNVLHKDFIGKKLDLKKNLTKLKRKKIVKNLSYKNVTGFRLEAKGRLTKRYTASRSIRKIRYKGNLLNIYSSYKGLSTILLKGNLKSNLQYTKLKSKSRIGSFGIKGWVSGT